MSPQQALFFAILVVAFGLLVTERLRNDLVALLVIIALASGGLLGPREALSGFGSEPAIVVVAILVLSGALHQTGLSDIVGHWIGRLAGRGYTRMIVVIMLGVGFFSAFTHHVTTTAAMLPVTQSLAREREMSPSKLLMPLSFAASLGTTITIIGAPAFLVASGVLQSGGRAGLSVFSIAPIGLALTLAGTLFIVVFGRWLLPDRGKADAPDDPFKLTEYFTELKILDNSSFVGRPVRDVEASEGHGHLFVTGWLRNGTTRRAPFGDQPLESGDVLLVRTSAEEIVAIRERSGVELLPVARFESGNEPAPKDGQVEDNLLQAIVAPGSDLVNRSLSDVDFRARYGAIVVGLWRQRGWINQALARVRLRAGDALLLQGNQEALARVATDRAFLMMVPFGGESRPRGKAGLAAAIMLGTVLLAAFNIVALDIAMLCGAVAMVAAGCIRARQAYRSIDPRIYVFIAGAMPLGDAMEKTGASKVMAGWLQGAVGGLSETLVLLLVFAIVAVITQFMSDAATVALFGPVAMALAEGLGRQPEAFVVTVAMAAVAAFLTPIGHHGNLLVYGPGRYQFADFVRVGTPLTVVVGLVVVLLSQFLWPG